MNGIKLKIQKINEYRPEVAPVLRKCKGCTTKLASLNKSDHCSVCYPKAYRSGYYSLTKKLWRTE